MLKKYAVAIGLVVCAATAVHAAPETYTLDGAHSSIGFSVRHMAISKVKGNFDEFEGSFTIDPADSSNWSCKAVIQVTSIDTDNEKRDGHLRTADFFDAENHPTITFESSKITPKGKGKFEIIGDFTMRGVTKPVVLEAEFIGQIKDPWGNERIGFTATGEINRMDFGVSWNNALETGGLVVSHEVELSLEVEGVRKVE